MRDQIVQGAAQATTIGHDHSTGRFRTDPHQPNRAIRRGGPESGHDVLDYIIENDRLQLEVELPALHFSQVHDFIDEGGKIRSIHQLKPYDLNSVTSDVPVKYAIELNEGMAKKAGAKVGDRLYIPEAARDAKE